MTALKYDPNAPPGIGGFLTAAGLVLQSSTVQQTQTDDGTGVKTDKGNGTWTYSNAAMTVTITIQDK